MKKSRQLRKRGFILRNLLALALVPVCLGSLTSLFRVFGHIHNANTIWVAMASGATCWIVVYVMLPKPLWIYVMGHETTHAIGAWVFGGRIKGFRVSSSGGHVDTTRSNLLIALAPYFLPIYALLILLLVSGLRFVWDMSALDPLWHFAIGAAYSFHITLTLHALSAKQTDISDNGALLSSVVIVAGNAAVLLLCIPLLTGQVGMTTALVWWGNDSLRFVSRIAVWLAAGIPPVFGWCQNSVLK